MPNGLIVSPSRLVLNVKGKLIFERSTYAKLAVDSGNTKISFSTYGFNINFLSPTEYSPSPFIFISNAGFASVVVFCSGIISIVF